VGSIESSEVGLEVLGVIWAAGVVSGLRSDGGPDATAVVVEGKTTLGAVDEVVANEVGDCSRACPGLVGPGGVVIGAAIDGGGGGSALVVEAAADAAEDATAAVAADEVARPVCADEEAGVDLVGRWRDLADFEDEVFGLFFDGFL